MNTWLIFQTLSSPFSLLVTLGGVWGLGLAVWGVEEGREEVLYGGGVLLVFILLGARLDYVLLHSPYFFSHGMEIPQVWLGGLNWTGAVVGGWLGLWLVSALSGRSLGRLLDVYLPVLGLLVASIGVAALFGGVGYGPKTSGWWGVPIGDEFGVITKRWPLHVLGGALGCGIALALSFPLRSVEWFSNPGRRGSAGFLGVMMIFTAVSALRVDPGIFMGSLRYQTWGGIVLSVFTFLSFIYYVRFADDY